jgi:pyruvate ferredoxin oxidoreductase gamma subunit
MKPSYRIIQDQSLLDVPGTLQGVRQGGGVIINSSSPIENVGAPSGVATMVVPASVMAIKFLGEPIPNTALLTAFLTLTNLLPLDAFEKVLAQRFQGNALDRNLRLMREAAVCVSAGLWALGGADPRYGVRDVRVRKDEEHAPGN